MPIDISAQNSAIPPTRLEDPLDQATKIAGLRSHQQQILASQEALKTHQLANAETARAQQDSAMFQQAHQDSGGDIPKAIDLARNRGVRLPFLNKVTDELNKQIE